MKTLKIRLALPAAAIAILVVSPATVATAGEAVIPPGNSAANQYTEAFPTPGGDKKTDEAPKRRSPVKVLGEDNARKLQQQGPEGQAAAEAAAATAPSPVAPAATSEDLDEAPAAAGGTGSSRNGGGSGGNGDSPAARGESPNASGAGANADQPAESPGGSSGIGSAFEQATGLSTSGQSGALLPLVILATILCSLAYLWRQRRQVG